MALNAADALFMDELFADLDASHFSIPPSQSPPKPKPIRLQGSQTSKVQNSCPSRPRAALSETTRFQTQPTLDLDLEDWFQQPAPPTPKLASRHSPSAVKRQKLDRGLEATTSTGASASNTPRQPREQCTYVRCRVVATVHGSYNVASDTHTGPARTRPEHLLVLEKDQLDSRSKRADGVRPQDAQQADVYLASLRDDWMQTIVSTGDIVHLVGRFERDLRKVPILLEQHSNASASNKGRSAPHPAIEIALEEPAANPAPPPDVRAESVESDDELWDDLASMPSLSQCATQEMLASDDAPQAQLMILASRSTDADSADNALDNLLVVHPDVLVPATKVADVASCIRKPVVQDRLRGASDTTVSLVMGNMLHELLQACLTAPPPPTTQAFPPPKFEDGESMPTAEVKAVSPWPERWQGIGDFSRAFVDHQIEEQVRSNVESLYAIELSAEDATAQLREKAAAFARFAHVFLQHEAEASFHPEANLREQSRGPESKPAKVRIRRILDVEEEIWSPAFGLKGKVDVSVECDIAEGSDPKPSRKVGSNSNGAFARGVQKQDSEAPPASKVTTSVVPLELKTGRAEVVSTEHRAQTMLYTLMMSDRYATRVNDGLLYYSKSGEMHRISRSRNEVRSLIIGRNELAHYLRHNPSRLAKPDPEAAQTDRVRVLPPTIDSEYKCRRCYAVDGCMLFRRAIENVVEPKEESNTSHEDVSRLSVAEAQGTDLVLARRTPIADVYEQKTSHLTAVHLEFFRKWDRLLNLEEEDAVRIRREMWTMSAEQREKAGRCFASMRLDLNALQLEEASAAPASSSMRRVVHRFVRHCQAGQDAEASVLAGHISVNDPVTISIEPDMLSVAQGFVTRVTPTSVDIGLDHSLDAVMQRALERDAEGSVDGPVGNQVAADRVVFRIDKDEFGSGMGRVRANLAALFLTPQRGGDVKRRELVVDMRAPRFLEPVQDERVRMVVAETRADASLNEDQRIAIDKVLSAQDYALVLGMPGTGKTTTIAKLIQLLVRLGKRILLTSYTHSAVDTILRKLAEDEPAKGEEEAMRILRLGSRDKVHADAHQFLLPRCSTLEELREAFESPNVVAATCLSVHHTFFSSGMAKLRSRRGADSPSESATDAAPEYLFDYCIVDEASQIPLPTCLGPLRFADKFVLVGDHHQLPPLVKNAEAKAGGLDVSLFKLLCERHGDAAMVALRSQYRMNADIMRLANELVYSGQLRAGTEQVRDRRLELPHLEAALQGAGVGGWMEEILKPESKVRFIDTAGLPLEMVGESKHGELVKNQFEAELVISIAEALLRAGCSADQVGVVTPYRQQIKLLRSLVATRASGVGRHALEDVEILTADQSQGRDKDVIIVTFTRANHVPSSTGARGGSTGELLNDLRRLNVSLTRAKRKLILIGHSPTLHASSVLSPLLDLVKQQGWIINVPSPHPTLSSQ
ncbi:DNA replication helicase DNA2 [Moesziomyces antarcticus]|uniref:DNA replication ATP-dependent helicase/nuclease DNA2 n=2 Tax=Pseudozyma antarctica TaxID=84753 RepID=A0A081CM15_PSEA2|nr:DNA replication helicase DNA2 [Moesziomyces antarcticus]GAK67711.1 DNA replication helicase DNA2 [Moesziomyces antarcticus]SPO49056.1 related to DNA2 - DNA helicase [Moesziomyces antarcticus]